MARSVEFIQNQILEAVAADPVLGPLLTSTSKRAIFVLWAFIVATSINMFEQLIDVFKSDVEATADRAAPSTGPWLQDYIFKFQYDATNPQVVQLINFAPKYPVIDPALRIITRCSVTSDLSNSVIIKVAKSEPPEALDTLELAAVQSYVDTSGTKGITYIVRSLNPDRLYIQASIFYTGLYSSVIKENVILAIRNYLASGFDFGGNVKISDIELAIRGVAGVTDVIMENVIARADITPLASGTYLVLNNATIARIWPTISGYIIEEDTAGNTFTDTLTFIPE